MQSKQAVKRRFIICLLFGKWILKAFYLHIVCRPLCGIVSSVDFKKIFTGKYNSYVIRLNIMTFPWAIKILMSVIRK